LAGTEQDRRPTCTWKATDQHRGWFHSSLLTACAIYDRAEQLTHGFTVDSKGKMSKEARTMA
jgi:isoleucyl-tRNA synthetase